MTRSAGALLVAVVCAAQVLVQLGAYFWPALLPELAARWSLSHTEAGWITAAFYGAYMAAVPVLVTLTDRVDPRRIYLSGVGCTVLAHLLFGLLAEDFWTALALRALAGFGWAGTYMTGLKLLADRVDAGLLSRAVTGHAASIGIAGALSFSCADLLAGALGWQSAFLAAAASAAVAWLLVAAGARGGRPVASATAHLSVFDFRPVFRNRSAMAYAAGYCIHTLEMNALRGWGVAFLGFVAGGSAGSGIVSPAYALTALGLLGTAASVLGNEAAARLGRRRLITFAMLGSALVGGSLGFLGTLSYWLAVGLMLLYGFLVWLDSSALTAGSAGTADPARRGATLAVHSTLGYAGGFAGPLLVGVILDGHGGMSRMAWGVSFLAVGALMLAALILFRMLRPREIAGDRYG